MLYPGGIQSVSQGENLGVLLSAFSNSNDPVYQVNLSRLFDLSSRSDGGPELLQAFPGCKITYGDRAAASVSPTVETLSRMLTLPLPRDYAATCHVLRALERLGRMSTGLEEILRCHTIPATANVLQYAYENDLHALALAATEALWTFCLQPPGKEVAAVLSTLSLLPHVALYALPRGLLELQRTSIGTMSAIVLQTYLCIYVSLYSLIAIHSVFA